MDFAWQDVFEFPPFFDNQQDTAKAEHTPTPVLEDDQTHLSFFESNQCDAVSIPQSYTFSEYGMPIYSSLEAYEEFSTTNNYIDLTTSEIDAALADCYLVQNESVLTEVPYYPVEDYSVDTASSDSYPVQNEPVMTEVPYYTVEDYPVQPAACSAEPQTQSEPQEQAPAPAEVTFPITFEITGYVNTEVLKPLPAPKKKTRKRKSCLEKYSSEWNCEPCGKSFKSKGGLSQHNQQRHSGPTPHGCRICGKRFRDFDTMQQHTQRHLMKDKPYKCEECPKQFIRYSDLARHVNLHHRECLHKCPICGKPFDRKDHLTDHIISHQNGTVKKLKVRTLSQTIC
ncbi:zinc finger protein 14 [Aedes aegypti]|uniref:C2H2-type domain-containing protein n=1 Tax=Aedes aegypti TaxID=7159 RepID=A0A1S4G026_AEDAE|nr:zinc finger protein 14 [Aedes aegypti]